MFERYTEKARQVIFFARYEASHFGSSSIETEHLLLGLLRGDKALINRFLPTAAFVESIRSQINSRTPTRDIVPTSVDLRLSQECKRALVYGGQEADHLNHKHIGTEHLLLGLLCSEKSFAAEILNQRGLALSQVREEIARPARISMGVYLATNSDSDYVDGEVQERNRSERDRGNIQTQFFVYFRNRLEQWGISVDPGLRLRVGPTRARVVDICVFLKDSTGVPFLCVEVVSSEDRVGRTLDRVNDYLAMGVPHVWVADPMTKAAFQITPTEGWREVKDGVLRTENPSFDVPLAEIFA